MRISIILRQYRLKKAIKFRLSFLINQNFFLFYFACLSKGLTVVPINPDLSSEEIKFIIEHSEAKLVIHTREIKYKLNSSKKIKEKSKFFKYK